MPRKNGDRETRIEDRPVAPDGPPRGRWLAPVLGFGLTLGGLGLTLSSLALTLSAAGCGSADRAAVAQERIPGNRSEPFVVLELFTSEGCSSCPPADRLLAKLQAEARRDHLSVYPLAFHVDYWDSLGWRDPFARSVYSERQRQYVRALDLDGPYTPQLIVNGHRGFVGSDERRVRREIDEALGSRASAWLRIDLRVSAHEGGLDVQYRVSPPSADAVIHFALTESGLTSRVTAGENAGRRLVHSGVVRDFETARLSGSPSGQRQIRLPRQTAPDADYSLVAYVQEVGTMRILGATRAEVDLAGGVFPAAAIPATDQARHP